MSIDSGQVLRSSILLVWSYYACSELLRICAHWVVLQLAFVEVNGKRGKGFALKSLLNGLALVEPGVRQEEVGVLLAQLGQLLFVFPLELLRDDHGLNLLN